VIKRTGKRRNGSMGERENLSASPALPLLIAKTADRF